MTSGRRRAVTTGVPQVADGDEPSAVVPLLRLHVLSARGLPRSPGAVGMPDPYVVVKFNDEKVGRFKVARWITLGEECGQPNCLPR